MRLGLARVFACACCAAALSPSPVRVFDRVFAADGLARLVTLARALDERERFHFAYGAPRTRLERALQSVLDELDGAAPPRARAARAGAGRGQRAFVEYWSRRRWMNLDAHRDIDELRLHDDRGARAPRPARYPRAGHVLYVDCEGPGPTCLFEDDAPAWWPRPTEARLAARDAPPTFKALHVVPARSNRVLVFDGTMMHGVPRPADVYINAAGAEGADAPVPSVRRHVVLFNVWDEAPPQRVPLADSERGGVDTDAEGVECACAPRARWGEAAPLEVPRGGEGKRSLKAALLGDSVRRGYAAEAITAAASSDVADAFSERSAPTVVQLDQGLNMALRAAHTLSKIMA